jgi:predicted chitinase
VSAGFSILTLSFFSPLSLVRQTNIMSLTLKQLRTVMPNLTSAKANLYLPHINSCLLEFEIDTELRVCHFLAQLAHESAELRYFQEIASGKAYEGRKDLGNTQKGDGVKYKGHGAIQITGRANHKACGEALGLDLINNPLLITLPEHTFRAAGWYWASRGLNALADRNDIRAITKKVNGGFNGLEDRMKYFARAIKAIPDDFNLYGLRVAADTGESSCKEDASAT